MLIKPGKLLQLILVCVSILLVACASDEERREQYLEKAQAQYEAGEYEKARINLKNAIQVSDEDAETRYRFALVEEKLKNWSEVAKHTQRALQIDPDHAKANVKMGKVMLLSGDMEAAAGYAQAAAELAANDPEALAFMALIKKNMGNLEEAVQLANQALELESGAV